MKSVFFITVFFISGLAHGQLFTDSILIEGHYRIFSYNLPQKSLKGGSIMFLMHGSGGSSKDMFSKTRGLQSIAIKEKLLIVYPDGYQHYWNECRKFSTAVANKEDINENAFFTAMISSFYEKYGIDKEKVFAAGFSGGGHMAYKLALTMPDKIKAITAIVANLPDAASCDCTFANKALPVLIINGTDDATNHYNGGQMFVNNANYGVMLSAENTFKYWATLAGFAGAPKKILLPDTDTTDHKTIEIYSYKWPHKPTVMLLKVIGGKHDYPGDIDVYLYAWQFFKSQMNFIKHH